MTKCRECMTELAPGAARCAACGVRQKLDPMIYVLLIALAVALVLGVAWYETDQRTRRALEGSDVPVFEVVCVELACA